MAPKRANETALEEPTGRERKKQKLNVARTIAVQPVPSGSGSGNAAVGPSNPIRTNSMKGLPSAIDVEKFTEARAFEIDAMQTAMKTANASSTQRAWQALPRHLRRRAASHDVRRVPQRLREKARAEMDPVRKKALGRSMPKRGKGKILSRTESLLKRQRDKTWLETHIWHAKRMKMENMWGYRLAVHPTEKAYRPSHRASIHGSILHDASYFSLVELKGPEKILVQILELCCDPQGPGPGSKRFLGGSRTFDTHMYRPGSYPFDHIGPITIIWKPMVSSSPGQNVPSQQDALSSTAKRNYKKRSIKGKEKSPASNLLDSQQVRTVWIWSHPVIYDAVTTALTATTTETINKFKSTSDNVQEEFNVEIADLRGQANVFEIMGPKANQVLKGALTPVSQERREEFLKFWSSLGDLQTSGSMPRGMAIGFKVNDPRLKFPPKNAKVKSTGPRHTNSNITFPTATLATSEIWDESIRIGLAKPKYKKKDLDDRRAKNVVPGTPLNPLRQDDRIPVLLIQRSVEQPSNDSETQSIHGWTLIIPSGWSMAFFNSLIFTGTRVAGQRERQTQAFEAGTSYFPRDYPFSAAYESYADEKATQEKCKWEKKPPAKRVNYEKIGTRNPWKADWRVVLGLQEAKKTVEQLEDNSEFLPTQRDIADHMSVDIPQEMEHQEEAIRPWLLRGSDVPSILSNTLQVFNHSTGLFSEINKLRLKRGHESLETGSIRAIDLLRGALVSVKVTICTRGAPEDMAMIYFIEDEEVQSWERILRKSKDDGLHAADQEHPEEIELANKVPSEERIIGYVTTGHYSLSRGSGFAIAAIPFARMIELQQQAVRLHPHQNMATSKPCPILIKVRNIDGHQCRAAHLEVLVT